MAWAWSPFIARTVLDGVRGQLAGGTLHILPSKGAMAFAEDD